MEMKANVASAIKEMMAQMNSGSESVATPKKDGEIKEENTTIKDNSLKKDDMEVKKNTVMGNFEPRTHFQSLHEAGSSFHNVIGNAIKDNSVEAEEVEKKVSENPLVSPVIEKKEEPEFKKTFGTTIPTPYGNSAVKLSAASSPATVAVKVSDTPIELAEPPELVIEAVQVVPKAPVFAEKRASDESYGKTVIASGTVINGDIISQGNLELSGEVLGNIKVDGELKIWGRVEGNIEVNSLDVLGGKVKGNILSVGHVNLDTDTIIAGNINASSLLLDGKLKGDVDIEGAVTIGSTGVQIGRITAKQLSIGQGAKLNSTIQMTNEDASAIAEEIFA